MKTTFGFIISTLLFFTSFIPAHGTDANRITILKDGGGADLLENSLVAITVAVTDGADFIELPVNLSSDDQLIVFRDTTLNRLTDVADLFPERNREDGSYYVVDFSLTELRQLRLKNVFEEDSNTLSLGIPTLKEALTVIQTLNKRAHKNSGVVISLIEPSFYNGEGKNTGRALKDTLDLLSYGPQGKVYIESADPDELQKISRWSQKDSSNKYSLIQAIDLEPVEAQDTLGTKSRRIQHSWLFTNSGLRILASYASAVTLSQEIMGAGNIDVDSFIQSLHNYDIKVFAGSSTKPTSAGVRSATLREFDGIYVDSLLQPPQEAVSLMEVEQTSQAQESESSLPPFFSNLGLSQPKPGANTPDFNSNSAGEDVE